MDFAVSFVFALVNVVLTSVVVAVHAVNRIAAIAIAVAVLVIGAVLLLQDSGGGWINPKFTLADVAIFMAVVWLPGMLFALLGSDPEKRILHRVFAIGTSAILGFLSPHLLLYLLFSGLK